MSAAIRPTRGLSAEDRRALLLGALIVAALGAYAVIGRPWYARLQSSRAELSQQLALLVREQALLESRSALPRLQRQVSQAVGAERPRLLNGDSVTATASLASFVDDIAVANGVHVSSLDGRAPLSAPGLTTVSVELRGESRWSQALGFVHTLESTGPLINVSSVRIERGARGGPLAGDLVTISATLSGIAAR